VTYGGIKHCSFFWDTVYISQQRQQCGCRGSVHRQPSLCSAVLCFYSKTGFWPSYCQISTDLDKILHTPIVVRSTLVDRLRPRSARGRL